jgi:hypothetical protein
MLNKEAAAKEDKECRMETTNVFEEYVARSDVQSFQAYEIKRQRKRCEIF